MNSKSVEACAVRTECRIQPEGSKFIAAGADIPVSPSLQSLQSHVHLEHISLTLIF